MGLEGLHFIPKQNSVFTGDIQILIGALVVLSGAVDGTPALREPEVGVIFG